MLAHLHSLKGALERTTHSTFSEALLPNLPQQLLGPFSRETWQMSCTFLSIPSYRNVIGTKGVFLVSSPKGNPVPKPRDTEAQRWRITRISNIRDAQYLPQIIGGIKTRKIDHPGRKVHSENKVHTENNSHVLNSQTWHQMKGMSLLHWSWLTLVLAVLCAQNCKLRQGSLALVSMCGAGPQGPCLMVPRDEGKHKRNTTTAIYMYLQSHLITFKLEFIFNVHIQ